MGEIQPLVSVIMPAYNSEKYIGKSIESVLAQDYEKFELIIVDDGSKDGTKSIVEQYAKNDIRIKLLEQANQGVSAARNKGLDTATGEYVAFLDSDDLWDADNLSVMVQATECTKSGLVCASMDIINADGTRQKANTAYKDGELMDFVTNNNEIRFFWGVGSVIIRRDILEKYHIRFDRGIAIMEDIGFYIKIFAVTNLKAVPRVMAHYCKHDNSATTAAYNSHKWEGSVEIFRHAEEYIKKYRPEWAEKYQKIWDYYAYRFIWTVVKNGMYDKANIYIHKYNENLSRFQYSGHKINDRIKCKLLMMNCKFLMRLLTGFKVERK